MGIFDYESTSGFDSAKLPDGVGGSWHDAGPLSREAEPDPDSLLDGMVVPLDVTKGFGPQEASQTENLTDAGPNIGRDGLASFPLAESDPIGTEADSAGE